MPTQPDADRLGAYARGAVAGDRRSWLPPTVVAVKILQIAPALHGAKMQTTEGSRPVVIWALVERDDGSTEVIGLAVGGKGQSGLIPPDPDSFQSYSQTG
jgi:hypothetical protein